ncbi:hypothetical protein EIP86_009357 [Pleurotus ostreatoroseus]|nr:hypothetical protein EIP86_009357 [Pleurotus ostreatoroseus]
MFAPKRSSGLDFSDGKVPALEQHPDVALNGSQPSHLQRNKTERRRLQGLQRVNSTAAAKVTAYEPQTWKEKWDRWMINEGGRRLFFFVWIFLHILVYTLGAMHYSLKDNLVGSRATFGETFGEWPSCTEAKLVFLMFYYLVIARTAALVLHVDVIFILLPVCRNFISLVRRTPLNHYIPFDKNITFHKATAWSIVFGTVVHIVAHMFNFAKLAFADPDATTPAKRFVAFLAANFATGPGITGWIMTAALFIMVWYAMEKRRRARFEVFWYTHHLFIVFFINWQLHGMFCMIKPDRPPYCSYNTIGVFWVSCDVF